MDQSFERKINGIPADYDEAMSILYGLYRERNQQSRLINAAADKKSTVKMKTGAGTASVLRLDDSCY